MLSDTEIRNSVAEALEVEPDELQNDTELNNLPNYDSTARLTLMVCISDLTGKPFNFTALEDLKTYGDIVALFDGTLAA